MPLLQELHFNPEQIVFKDNDETNSIYFVSKGELEIFIADDSFEERKAVSKIKILHTIGRGQVFGVQEFFTGGVRNFNIRSKSFSTCLKIDRN